MIPFFILAVAIVGMLACVHIYSTKKQGKQLVCVIGTDCDKVVHSEYSEVLGVPLENIGMLYYGAIILLTGCMISGIQEFWIFEVDFVLSALSAMGAFLSIVFIFIQLAVLKDWCEYCLISAGSSFIIFALKFFI